MATTPLFVQSRRSQGDQFVAAFGTRPRVVWTPGASGSEIEAINIASTSGSANKVRLYRGQVLTEQSNMGAGALVDGGGGTDSVTRSSGSFLDDGWRANNLMALVGATTVANNFAATLTTATALSLSIATGTVDTAEPLAAGASLYLLQLFGLIEVPANAGNISAVPSVSALDETELPILDRTPNRHIRLGAADRLFAALDAAPGVGEQVDLVCLGGDY